MAKIVPTELAPAEEVTYSLPGADFSLDSGGSFESDNRAVLLEAEAHPWLEVEYSKEEAPVSNFRPDTVAPKDDVLSAEHSEAFDPEAIKRDTDAVLGTEDAAPLAVEAGLKQSKATFTGDVARTIAADRKQTDEIEKDND